MKSYLITDPKYYSNNVDEFRSILDKSLKKYKPDLACFRDKESINFIELAKVFVEICRKNAIKKVLINRDFKLAKELKADGVHLTSKQFKDIKKAKELDLFTIISCHSLSDIEKAQRKYANAVTYSPIFETPNKAQAKGVNKLKEAISLYDDMDIIALGGIINKEQIKKIEKSDAYAYASIRYFTK